MEFEWDEAKSAANREKHGIDFAEARALWDEQRFVESETSLRGELRFGRVARLRGKLWFAVFTLRGGKVRLISVRRARKDEEAGYGPD